VALTVFVLKDDEESVVTDEILSVLVFAFENDEETVVDD
jgi:hypothetical protein